MRKVIKMIFFVGICCGWSLVYGNTIDFSAEDGRPLPAGTSVWIYDATYKEKTFSQGRLSSDGKVKNLQVPRNTDYIVEISIPGRPTIKHTFKKGTVLAPSYFVTVDDIKLGSSPGKKLPSRDKANAGRDQR